MEHRLAFGATSVAQVCENLVAFINGRAAHQVDCYQGTVDEHRGAMSVLQDDEDLLRTVDHWFAKGKFNKLLALWVKGLHVDWQRLQGDSGVRRVSLPTYPFAREFFWLDLGAQVAALPTGFVASQGVAPALHPLVQENHSRLDSVRYTSRFDASEAVLRDHQVARRPLLPAAAQVEMLRCAVTVAAGQAADQVMPMRLRDLAWVAPVSAEQPLTLALDVERGADNSLQLRLGQGTMIHCQGSVDFPASMPQAAVDLDSLRNSHPQPDLVPSEFYRRLAEHGLAYGPSLRTLNWFGRQADSVLVGLQSDPSAYADPRYVIDPGLLDGVLQALALFEAGSDAAQTTLALPFAVQSIELFAACRGSVWAHLRRSAFNALGPKTDIDVYDQGGRLCLSLRGLVTRGFVVETAPVEDDNALVMLSPRWTLANL
ncbi:Polyketide synthase PksN [compost metagenome]